MVVWGLLETSSLAADFFVHFDKDEYVVRGPGETFEARVLLDSNPNTPQDDPIGVGLFSDAVSLTLDSGKAQLGAVSDILVPSEMDNFGFSPGGFRTVTPGFAGVKGNIDQNASPLVPYAETLLVTFKLTNVATAPDNYPLPLDFFRTLGANEQLFLDGDFSPLDATVRFGSARVLVVPEPTAAALTAPVWFSCCWHLADNLAKQPKDLGGMDRSRHNDRKRSSGVYRTERLRRAANFDGLTRFVLLGGGNVRDGQRQLAFETLETRHLLTAVSFLNDNVPWKPEGPSPILNGQGENIPHERPVVGAIQAVAAHPTNPGILWVGTANGGVWRSESKVYATDGLDNNNNGLIDAADPNEVWTATYNNDNFDNDHDGQTDEADEVRWTALTDTQKSLAIGDLVLDPTDASGNTLIVGLGRASSADFSGGPANGALLITDAARTAAAGGATVRELTLGPGRNIGGVAAGRTPGGDHVVLIAANAYGVNTPGLAGVYQILKPGELGEQVSLLSGTGNLPRGPAYDVIADPANPNRFYVAIGGDAAAASKGGLFRTDDGGASWIPVGAKPVTDHGAPSPFATPNDSISAATANMELAIHNSGGDNVLYVAVVNLDLKQPPVVLKDNPNPDVLSAVFFTTNQGDKHWTAMDVPGTKENGIRLGIHPGGQGNRHLSLAADPTNPNLVYIGGDRQPLFGDPGTNSLGATDFAGRLFRGDRTVAAIGDMPSPQWTALTHTGTANKSAPHSDSRNMTVDAGGQLIETDDGGVYRRTSPTNSSGDWFSISGTLQISEIVSTAYDGNSKTIIGGAQDNGTSRQDVAGSSTTWRQFQGADGGDVAVDPFTLAGSGQSIRYSSTQSLGNMRRSVLDANNNNVPNGQTDLFAKDGKGHDIFPVGFTPSFFTPLEVNAVRPTAAQLSGNQSTRVVIGANTVFEANNAATAATGAVAWTQVQTAAGFNGVNEAAMAYGGHRRGAGISAVTNASPIVITSSGHGLTTGAQVEIEGVQGNTAANGSFIVTVIDANTFSLNGSLGNANFTHGGSWRLANPDLLYAGSSNQVWVRSTAGGTLTPGGALIDADGNAAGLIRDVTTDPDDQFVLASGTLSGSVAGDLGDDTLVGDNVANAFIVTGVNAGTATGVSGFSDIENLTGNANVDTLSLVGGTLTGTLFGNTGNDTLLADDVNNTIQITGANSGMLNGLSFSRIENLTGGNQSDTISVDVAGS